MNHRESDVNNTRDCEVVSFISPEENLTDEKNDKIRIEKRRGFSRYKKSNLEKNYIFPIHLCLISLK